MPLLGTSRGVFLVQLQGSYSVCKQCALEPWDEFHKVHTHKALGPAKSKNTREGEEIMARSGEADTHTNRSVSAGRAPG